MIIIYNSRDERADCTKALEQLRYKCSAEFHGFSNGMSHEKCIAFFDGRCDVFCTANTQVYNRQRYVERVLSSSCSLKEVDEGYAAYLTDIHGIFDLYSTNGCIAIPTNTVAYIGSVSSKEDPSRAAEQ